MNRQNCSQDFDQSEFSVSSAGQQTLLSRAQLCPYGPTWLGFAEAVRRVVLSRESRRTIPTRRYPSNPLYGSSSVVRQGHLVRRGSRRCRSGNRDRCGGSNSPQAGAWKWPFAMRRARAPCRCGRASSSPRRVASKGRVGRSHHRAVDWPTSPRDDPRVVLRVCEREMDDALGVLLGSAGGALQAHVGFMLGQD